MQATFLKTALFAAMVIGSAAAHAAPVSYAFSAYGFASSNGNEPPSSTIAGTFTIDGNTLTQIDLTVGSYQFKAANVALVQDSSEFMLSGIIDGDSNSIAWGENDFWLIWSSVNGAPKFFEFAYSTDAVDDFYRSSGGTISAVPVPAAAWLFGSGLVGLAGLGRKRKLA